VDRRRDPRPWLFGIANNLIRRHHRAEERLIRSYAAIERQPETAGRNGQPGESETLLSVRAPMLDRAMILESANWEGMKWRPLTRL
jgi:DNA-directed RNA polymerase specialized sigma24 family protein